MIRTTDGGETWVEQIAETRKTLRGIAFLGPQTGWAIGEDGLILHTSDGGETWKSQANSAQANLLDIFLYGNGGWIVGADGTILRLAY